MSYDSTIKYGIPKDAIMHVSFQPNERDISLKLLEGSVEIRMGDTVTSLHLEQEFPFPVMQCLEAILTTTTGCTFELRGNHYVYSAVVQVASLCFYLFSVSMTDNSTIFNIKQNVQLEVIPNESNAEVSIERICPHPHMFVNEIFCELYDVPLSARPLLINTLGDCLYCVKIQGKRRRITVSLTECVPDMEILLLYYCLPMQMKPMYEPHVVLMLDSQHLGITSFCHPLMSFYNNKSLPPMFIDLDVSRNLNTVLPGIVSAAESESGQHISYLNKYLLHFGHLEINHDNRHLYYFLIRRMGALLTSSRNRWNIKNSGAVIHLSGSLTLHCPTIKCILESFNVKRIIFIGEQTHYQNMRALAFENVASNILYKPPINASRNKLAESEHGIARYFQGVRNFHSRSKFEVNLHNIHIYRVSAVTLDEGKTDITVDELRFEAVVCDPSIEGAVLSVSKTTLLDTSHPTADVVEIKYCVCVEKVNMDKNTALILSPIEEIIDGGVLLIEDMKMPRRPTQVSAEATGNNT